MYVQSYDKPVNLLGTFDFTKQKGKMLRSWYDLISMHKHRRLQSFMQQKMF